MNVVLEAHQLSFAYPGELPLFGDIDLKVARGEFLGIVGLSGCGKSTLAYCLSGIIPKLIQGELSGQVLIKGEPISKYSLPQIAQRIGMVFQNPETQLLFSTVCDEVAFAPENLQVPSEEIEDRIRQVLDRLGISHLWFAHPYRLSGGQKQLVALASVLSLEPDILILDEAASQIDRPGRERILQVVHQLRMAGKTIIAIEHDLDNLRGADRILVLRNGRLEPFVNQL